MASAHQSKRATCQRPRRPRRATRRPGARGCVDATARGMDLGGDGADAARRARRLAANRAASAASRKRKREVELETRRRVDALESLVRAMAAENATLREALMTVACGGGVEGGWEARKVPLPRAERDARARGNENASSPA